MSKQNDGFNKSVAREEGHAQWSTSKEPYRDKTTIFVLVWEEKNRKGRRVGGISKNKNENKIEWPSNKNNKTTSVVLCTESILIHRSKRAFGECIYYFYDHHPMSIQQHQIHRQCCTYNGKQVPGTQAAALLKYHSVSFCLLLLLLFLLLWSNMPFNSCNKNQPKHELFHYIQNCAIYALYEDHHQRLTLRGSYTATIILTSGRKTEKVSSHP